MLLQDFIDQYFFKESKNVRIENGTYHPCDFCIQRDTEYEDLDFECNGCRALYIIIDESEMIVIFEDLDDEFKINHVNGIIQKEEDYYVGI